jgi:hypothetical protein
MSRISRGCSHLKKSLQSGNSALIILYHDETKRSLRNTLKKFDIIVDRYEADRFLGVRVSNEIIFKPILDRFMQHLKTLESLPHKYPAEELHY